MTTTDRSLDFENPCNTLAADELAGARGYVHDACEQLRLAAKNLRMAGNEASAMEATEAMGPLMDLADAIDRIGV